jgi:hypothetical protein
MPTAPNFLSISPVSTADAEVFILVTAQSTSLIVAPGGTVCPHIQLSNIGRGGQFCDDCTNLHS